MNFQTLAAIIFGSLSLMTLAISGYKVLKKELSETLDDDESEKKVTQIIMKNNLKFRAKIGNKIFSGKYFYSKSKKNKPIAKIVIEKENNHHEKVMA